MAHRCLAIVGIRPNEYVRSYPSFSFLIAKSSNHIHRDTGPLMDVVLLFWRRKSMPSIRLPAVTWYQPCEHITFVARLIERDICRGVSDDAWCGRARLCKKSVGHCCAASAVKICGDLHRASSDSFTPNSKALFSKDGRVDDAASLYQSRGSNTRN